MKIMLKSVADTMGVSGWSKVQREMLNYICGESPGFKLQAVPVSKPEQGRRPETSRINFGYNRF